MNANSPTSQALTAGAWVSHRPQDTLELGAHVGEHLCGGEIVLLRGGLGAGKTLFVKGVAGALGIDSDEVTSPSFTLVNRYDGGRLTLYHLDLYRLSDGASAAHHVGLDELLADERAVIVIEWAERLKDYALPQSEIWKVSIAGDGDDPRRIVLSQAS
ncbi:MAG: tRNA (adenosine(37)-N6)-threonylcarbamoyltransferase complex ATPase subunit type 1 TsaE [Pyrinomonadaceae bacterium]|nr:tRNA (adenosine(37)-N6)-threonylcarbamoyltransferase complex ATPase subunit type 1 TsaE [Pyrinomonadaceae bacterium]